MVRDALILAAGFGSRLRDLSESKPLTPVAGVPLIERGIRNLASIGIERVVVVTGHEAVRVEMFLADLHERVGLEIEAARVEDWSKPNGWSVLAGAGRLPGDYLLQMADHIFDPVILSQLAGAGSSSSGVTLAIDRRLDNPLVDPDDATWVQTGVAGRIVAIGKSITAYDAVDCGAFLATPELADGIGKAIAGGAAGSLSEGMQYLADRGRAATMDIGDAWWIDVDDPKSHSLAESALG